MWVFSVFTDKIKRIYKSLNVVTIKRTDALKYVFINKIENAKYFTISGSGMFNLFKLHDTVSQLLRLLLNLHGLKMQSNPF